MVKRTMVLFSLVVLLVGCQDASVKSNPTTNVGSNTPITSTPGPGIESQLMTVEKIKESMKLGMTKEQVKDVLGSNYKELKVEQRTVWRYNFGMKDGYKFDPKMFLDEVDLQGLRDGNLAMQVFIHWDQTETKVGTFFAYYKSNEQINEYQVFPNGEIRELAICCEK